MVIKYDELLEDYINCTGLINSFPEDNIYKFINLILNSTNIDYYEYYDEIVITNENGEFLINLKESKFALNLHRNKC